MPVRRRAGYPPRTCHATIIINITPLILKQYVQSSTTTTINTNIRALNSIIPVVVHTCTAVPYTIILLTLLYYHDVVFLKSRVHASMCGPASGGGWRGGERGTHTKKVEIPGLVCSVLACCQRQKTLEAKTTVLVNILFIVYEVP